MRSTVNSGVPLAEVIELSADLSSRAALAFIREELEELRRGELLGPDELRWAVEHLLSSGVCLPDVLGVVFDFAEIEWLGELATEVTMGYDSTLLADLARQVGIDPITGKRLTPVPARTLLESLPPNFKLNRRDASAVGCEGVRQRPLRGWHY